MMKNLERLFPLFEISVVPEETFQNNTGIFGFQMQSLKLIQGSIPPSMNQTLYNSTKQSYMSCLENSTRNINFTKQNLRRSLPGVDSLRELFLPAFHCNGAFRPPYDKIIKDAKKGKRQKRLICMKQRSLKIPSLR